MSDGWVFLNKSAGAPGSEHERLRAELENWSIQRGFEKSPAVFPQDMRPDVLGEKQSSEGKFLFLGDAKDFANETAGRQDTCDEIEKYFTEFCKLLSKGYAGGTLAIATNDAKAANDWVPKLNEIAQKASLKAPSFKNEQISTEAWVIYW